MKSILLIVVILGMIACGETTEPTTETSVVTDSVMVDSVAIDSVVVDTME